MATFVDADEPACVALVPVTPVRALVAEAGQLPRPDPTFVTH